MTDSEKQTRLAELERIWRERFMKQPKLPTSALLTGAVAMALGFGAVLFLLSATMRQHAWIWICLSAACGVTNRILANRWYRKVVVPWSDERIAMKAEIDALRVTPGVVYEK